MWPRMGGGSTRAAASESSRGRPARSGWAVRRHTVDHRRGEPQTFAKQPEVVGDRSGINDGVVQLEPSAASPAFVVGGQRAHTRRVRHLDGRRASDRAAVETDPPAAGDPNHLEVEAIGPWAAAVYTDCVNYPVTGLSPQRVVPA